MLADSIDGGILAFLFVCGGLATSLVALVALVPASQGNRRLTLILIAPASICGLLFTVYFACGYVKDGLHDPSYELSDFILPWAFMAGPALVTSLIAIFVVWLKRTKAKSVK